MTTLVKTDPRTVAVEAVQRGALQKLGELTPLLELLAVEQPKVIVEIGTCKGQTFAAYSKVAAPMPFLVSVDLPGGDYGGGLPKGQERLIRGWCARDAETHFIAGDSHDAAVRNAVGRTLAGRKADFLMIDGDHTYEGCMADWVSYSPLVRHGGLVAFHDILEHDEKMNCHVDRVWWEVRHLAFDESWEFTVPEDLARWGVWGGIGVVRV